MTRPAPYDQDRDDAIARGQARMDEARAATGDWMYRLVVLEIDEQRNVPSVWQAVLVRRP